MHNINVDTSLPLSQLDIHLKEHHLVHGVPLEVPGLLQLDGQLSHLVLGESDPHTVQHLLKKKL